MNKITGKVNYFSVIQNLIKQNVKAIIFFVVVVIIVIAGLQVYFIYQNKKIIVIEKIF